MQFRLNSFEEVVAVTRLSNIQYFEFSNLFHGSVDNHPFRELVFIDNGTITIHSDSYNGPLEKNQIVIHKAGENHYLTCEDQSPPNVIVIGFECDCPILDVFAETSVTLTSSQVRMLTEVVREGRAVYAPPYDIPYNNDMKKRANYPFGADQMIRLRLEMFLISLIRSWQNTPPLTAVVDYQESENFLEIRQYIEANYCTTIRLDELCALFHTNKTSLCRHFRDSYNMTIMDYVNYLRIREAKVLLRQGGMNITQIATQLGYSSVHYFSHTFKKYERLTPTEYRLSVKSRFDG